MDELNIEKEVNPHFEDFLFDWLSKFYFLVGGYGSSKSYHVALKLILKLLGEKRTALVVREVYDTIRDSCFSLFEEIITDLELDDQIKLVTSPMQIRFPNGSKIIFKGMDKPQKLKSVHNVSIIWIEECSELKYEGFKELIGRLRHPNLALHMILSTNPVGKGNWTFIHFFKNIGLDDELLYNQRTLRIGNTYYHHSLADDNLFLPHSYIEQLDEFKTYDPDKYRIARQGRFGINGIIVLPQFEVQPYELVMQAVHGIPESMKKAGFDFGFVTSHNALLRIAIHHEKKWLYIYWEYYKNQMTDDKTAEDIEEFKKTRELIKADSAEPKTIQYFRQQGFRIQGAKKFQGSRLQNTKKVKRFKKIICADTCVNTISELKELTYKVDKDGNIIEDEFSIDPHTFSAIWYALDGYEVSDLKGGKGFSMQV
ncbi:PBSX family phage terminase large subunit [Sporomusa sphaeroides]|uniref:PBSX family phage terminase large subunit n=1 Tax=Sporomusa sphaeroides TaxID=47679 RepID=UPI00203079D5|nr:PBSX family phage terminase large subunit [Sporomusa sphaeroides]MCM0759959.1 PBSX family phage terminase large subunit [Sporomusa sphaeroides DSM 2875]HML33843.1 PBSX family phage terminase large subunit [Sporomusa sphaeroides]